MLPTLLYGQFERSRFSGTSSVIDTTRIYIRLSLLYDFHEYFSPVMLTAFNHCFDSNGVSQS